MSIEVLAIEKPAIDFRVQYLLIAVCVIMFFMSFLLPYVFYDCSADNY
ncbi:hypothetical protein SDC9_182168 [bioreactor metagenome]|uniref:Uncharacterized protein n=1 Tax=bioreactor metagenome TaxID=1076179 RepID=A0A645HEY7_9ZZZZ